MRAWVAQLGLVVLLSGPSLVKASDTAETQRLTKIAQRHFEDAKAFLLQGKADLALAEFRASYEISKLPSLLHNMSLCYEMLRDYGNAIEAEKKFYFLNDELSTEERDQAQGRIARLEVQRAQQKTTPTPAQTPPPPADPVTPVVTTPSVATPPASSGNRKAVVGASVGIGVGAVLSIAGFGLLGAASASARSIEREPRTLLDLQTELDRRDRLEAGGIALSIAGPLIVVGSSVALVKLKNRK